MRGEMVCNTVCLSMVSTSNFLSCLMNQSSLVDETPREEIYDNKDPLEDLSLDRGVQRMSLPESVVFR